MDKQSNFTHTITVIFRLNANVSLDVSFLQSGTSKTFTLTLIMF